jgi:adenylate cyclase
MASHGRRTISSILKCLVISGITAVAVLLIRSTGLLEPLDLLAYDWAIRHQPTLIRDDDRVVLLTITEEDVQVYGYPISDALLAHAIEQLVQFGPRAVGLDIYRDMPVPPGHERFEAVLSTHPSVIVVRKVGGDGGEAVLPPPVVKDLDQVGASDVVMDAGGIVRRALLFIGDGDETLFSLPLRLALLYLAQEGVVPRPGQSDPQEIRLGENTLHRFRADDGGYVKADDAGYQILRDYRRPPEAYRAFSLRALLGGQVDPSLVHDRVVLIGMTAGSVPDIFHTPYHTGLVAPRPTPGVALHAQLVEQLLRTAVDGQVHRRTLSDGQEAMWTILAGVVAGTLALGAQSPWRVALTAGGGMIMVVSLAFLCFVEALWIPVASPLLAWIGAIAGVMAYTSHEERKQRTLVVQLFSPYVGPQVVQELILDAEKAQLGLRLRREVTILFCDIVGFVKFCETHTVDQIVDQMDEYLEAMTEVIFHWKGTLVDFTGDEICALWGAPLEQPDHVERAVKCAIHIRRRLTELNGKWAAEGKVRLENGIGLNTGQVVFASMGAKGKRMKFAAVGDPVNLASRVEGLTRKFDAPIMMTEFTGERVKPLLVPDQGDDSQGRLAHVALRKVAAVKLKGREEPVVVYELAPLQRHEASRIEEPEEITRVVMTEK